MASTSPSHPLRPATNIIMTSTSLSDFPAELILNIYESFDDHHAITALNLTSRKFYEIWRLNTATIAEIVLPRVIDCFDMAQELLVIQGRSADGQLETRAAVLEWSKRLVTIASRVLKYYASGSNGLRKLLEFTEFTESFYLIWIILELYPDRQAQDLRLEAATLKELRGMGMTLYLLGDFDLDDLDALNWRSVSLEDKFDAFCMITEQIKLKFSLS